MTEMHLALCCNFDKSMMEQITTYRQFMRQSNGAVASASTGPSHMTVRQCASRECL